MKSRQAGSTQEASAEKSEVSVRTGRRIDKSENTGKKERHWRTRTLPAMEGRSSSRLGTPQTLG